jgi:ketosteroid isomerase-like protein
VRHSRTLLGGALAAAILIVPLAAAPARAQAGIIPSQNNDLSPDVQRFRAAAMQDAQQTLNAWRAAWEQDDVNDLMRLYQKDALVVLPGTTTPAQGTQAIEEALKENLPKLGVIQWRFVDAAIDDHLLFIYQRYVVEPSVADTSAERSVQSGTATLVLQRDGNRWRIRAQIFSPEFPAPAPAATAAATPQPSPVQATTDH